MLALAHYLYVQHHFGFAAWSFALAQANAERGFIAQTMFRDAVNRDPSTLPESVRKLMDTTAEMQSDYWRGLGTLSWADLGISGEASNAAATPASAKVVIANLPKSVTEQDLRALFSQWGDVASARVVERAEPRPGIGFVEMPEKFAELAAARLNGLAFRQAELAVTMAQ